MPTNIRGDDLTLGAFVVAPCDANRFWPIESRWRAAVDVRGELRPPELLLQQVKPVPLSSRVERSLLGWSRTDDGREILRHASEPGEHRVAAAVIAALRLADQYPDRSLRFLEWLAQAPDDPADLRFLRRYLPGLHVLVRLDTDLGVAMPLGRDALGLLAAELFRAAGDDARAEAVLATVTPSAPSAIATTALRLSANDAAGAHALAHGRPVDDDLGAALRIMDARASTLDGESSVALTEITNLVDSHAVSRPIDRLARVARVAALRAAGRDQEADLIDDEFMRGGGDPATPRTETEPSVPVEAEPERPAEPQPPLFGRSLADALDDAWARVRRQPLQGALDPLTDRARIEGLCDEAVALIGAGHTESAEATLLLHMDTVDAQVDAGGVVVDDFFVLLAGMFDRLGLTTEEAATLERLRSAHQRAGSELPGPIEERLVEIRAMLDDLG